MRAESVIVLWIAAVAAVAPASAATAPDSSSAAASDSSKPAAPNAPSAATLGALAPGAFLRVRSDAGVVEGSLLRAAPDTLVLAHAKGEQHLPIGAITSVDERRSRTGRGARIGGLLGAVLGAGALAIAARTSDDEGFCESDCGVGSAFPVLIGGALGGGFVGACLGAVTGSYFPAWEPDYKRP